MRTAVDQSTFATLAAAPLGSLIGDFSVEQAARITHASTTARPDRIAGLPRSRQITWA
jgi:hypothetical protein